MSTSDVFERLHADDSDDLALAAGVVEHALDYVEKALKVYDKTQRESRVAGLSVTDTQLIEKRDQQAQRLYRALMHCYHPDTTPWPDEAVQRIEWIRETYRLRQVVILWRWLLVGMRAQPLAGDAEKTLLLERLSEEYWEATQYLTLVRQHTEALQAQIVQTAA